jgi:hypothetical protein
MNGWEKMFDRWHREYYGDPFMFVCEATAIIIGIIYQRKNRIGQFFIFYIVFDITILLLDEYIANFSNFTKKEVRIFVFTTNSMVFMSELLAYFFFFQKTLRSRLIKKTMSVLGLVFIVLTFFYLLHMIIYGELKMGFIDMNYLGVIEFFFLIVPCVFYFSELFTKQSEKKLLQRPSFWITTGIFFYSFVSIPLYFITDYLSKSQYQYMDELNALLFCLPFGISFLFLSKAFTCKTELTT